MSKHTPGPWEPGAPVKDSLLGARVQVYSSGAPEGSRMPAECYGPDAVANARLIAAAPGLFDLLKAVTGRSLSVEDILRARALIESIEAES